MGHPKITADTIKELLADGLEFVGDRVRQVYSNDINSAYTDAIEIGLENTILSLYDAEVDDRKIIFLLTQYWGICREEAEQRLLFEKSQIPIKVLENHLKLKGMSEEAIHRYMKENSVRIKISHNPDLWKYWRNPEELMLEIQKLSKHEESKI